jgi:hypothetical protein
MQLQTNRQPGPANGSASGQSGKMAFFRWGVDRAKSVGKTAASTAVTSTIVLTAADFVKNTAVEKGDLIGALAPTVNDVFNVLARFAGFFYNHPYFTAGIVLAATTMGAIKAHLEKTAGPHPPITSPGTLAAWDRGIANVQGVLKTGLAAVGKAIKPIALVLLGSDFIIGVTTSGWGAFGKVWADMWTAASWASSVLLAAPALTVAAIFAIIGAKRFQSSRTAKRMREEEDLRFTNDKIEDLEQNADFVSSDITFRDVALNAVDAAKRLLENGKPDEAAKLVAAAKLLLTKFRLTDEEREN